MSGFRKILRLIGEDTRGRWVLILLLAVLVSVSEVVGAFLIFVLLGLVTEPDRPLVLPLLGDATERFPELNASELLVLAAASIAVFFVLRGGLYLVQTYLQNRVAQGTGVRLSTQLVHGYMRMPYSEHTSRNSSELIRTAYASVSEIVGGVLVPATAFISESFIVLGVFVALLLLAPEVTLGAAALVGSLILLLLKVVQPRMAALGATNQHAVGESLKTLQQSFEGIRDIKVLGRESFFERQFARHRATTARTAYLRAVLLDAPRAVVETSLIVLIVSFLVVSLRTSESPEDLLALLGVFAYAVLRVLPSVNRIVANGNSMRFGAAAVEHVLRDLAAFRSEADRGPDEGADLRLTGEIRLADVTFSYQPDQRPVLVDVRLQIRRGESLGIVGATGAGKSTLLDIILGLLVPTQGAVLVDGADIQENLRAWHRNLGVVPQAVFLLDDTLRRNIALGEEASEIDEAAVARSLETAQLAEFVSSLDEGLDTVVGERGVRLSGGQRQRVAIARALYRNPSVLIFDEGTSALDNATEAAFTGALDRLRGERTIITVAHRLSTVRDHDRIVVLDGGRISDIGSYDELSERSTVFRAMAG